MYPISALAIDEPSKVGGGTRCGGAVFKSRTRHASGQHGVASRRETVWTSPVRDVRLGTGWHFGQKYDDRFMNAIRRIGSAAPVARLALAAVGVQRAVEVAGLAVDVDVERVERRPALAERLGHDVAGLVEHLADLLRGQPVPRPVAVQPGPPERLVGVDVADAGDQALVEEQPLHPGGTPPHAAYEVGVVELRVERVAGDVLDLRGQVGAAVGDGQAAEHPLVDEPQLHAWWFRDGCCATSSTTEDYLGG